MSSLLSILLGVCVVTFPASAATNLVSPTTATNGLSTAGSIASVESVEREYLRLLEMDNDSQAEVDRWLTEGDKLAAVGAAADNGTLRLRIRQRFEPVEKAYQHFLERNPKHFKARVAYGSFLGDIGREDEAKDQYIIARDLDPKNPAPWNNLANFYGHNGEVTNAFLCYAKAIELNPKEPVYYQNFATTVYLFRWDATNHFRISEQQVFDKAMGLYRQALVLDPENFPLATDLAQTYYGIQPPRVPDAFQAWNEALKIARDDIEREGVHIHFARWHRTAGDFLAVRRELNQVTNQMYAVTKERILKSLERKEASATNAPPASAAP